MNRMLDACRNVFATDLRTLALFRAVLGTVLLLMLLQRLPDLGAFYTDDGLMPRDWLLASENPWRLSLHFANGTALFQGLLLGCSVLAALAFIVGYRTRLATLLSWLLLVSLHSRNPLVLTGGDYLMVCLLFWSLFLPLSARWSIDAAFSSTPPPTDNRHLSWASAGLLLQILSVYFFSALMKSDAVWWPDGSAVYYALSLDAYSTALGRWLLGFPLLLKWLSWYVYWLELIGPLLALSPLLMRPLRFAVMLLLMLMHIGFLLCMELGHFPWVSLASLTALTGGWIWDALATRDDRRPAGSVRIYYDSDCGFCRKTTLLLREFLILRRAGIEPARSSARAQALLEANNSWVVIDAADEAHLKWAALVALLRASPLLFWLWPLARLPLWSAPGNAVYHFVARHRQRFAAASGWLLAERKVRFEAGRAAQCVSALFVVAVAIWNTATVQAQLVSPLTQVLAPVLYPLRLDQSWNMFAPAPSKDNGWFVAPGRLADGREVDVLKPDAPLSFEKPADPYGDMGNIRWKAWRNRMWDRNFRHHRQQWAGYLCRQWNGNRTESERLTQFRIIYMLQRTLPDFQPAPVEQRVLWRHDCTAKPADVPTEDGAATE
jgi:predicted DCC family thiol-disulfide oxidoreductase YuxK